MPVAIKYVNHFNSAGATLAAGQRASPGTVGYRGTLAELTTYNPGGTPPSGWSWDVNTLVSTGAGAALDHARINGSVVANHSGVVVTNCRILPPAGEFFGVTLSGGGKGFLVVKDTTVVGTSQPTGQQYQVNGVSSDSGLIAVRCDVSGTGDGIHAVADPSTWTGGEVGIGSGTNARAGSIISQCYVHDLAFVDEAQHLDGFQTFNHATLQAFMIVEHNHVAQTLSTIGTPMNAGLTLALPPVNSGEPLVTATVDNNLFVAGLFHMRVQYRLQNTLVTNNNLGVLNANEFDVRVTEVPASVITWSNNRDGSGAAGTGTTVTIT